MFLAPGPGRGAPTVGAAVQKSSGPNTAAPRVLPPSLSYADKFQMSSTAFCVHSDSSENTEGVVISLFQDTSTQRRTEPAFTHGAVTGTCRHRLQSKATRPGPPAQSLLKGKVTLTIGGQ